MMDPTMTAAAEGAADAAQALEVLRGAAAMAQPVLQQPLASYVTREPVSCLPQTPIRTVLETMRRERIGAMVVADAMRRPLGVFTLRDVLEKVALRQVELALPVAEVMGERVFTLPGSTPASEAALLMAREGIRYVLVVEGGVLTGVVSESRLFSAWGGGLGDTGAAIRAARDVDGVVAAASRIGALAGRLRQQGLRPESVTHVITTLDDLTTQQLIEVCGGTPLMQAAGACWIALGSQGRAEQTLATDQDNAIVFADGGDPEAHRRTLLPFAREVNEALDRSGFALCRGDIMAGNATWCLSVSEWRVRFTEWIDRADPRALLNATIFFDFRPVYGNHALAAGLREWLAGYAPDRGRFLLQLARNALDNQPPLGLVRDFVLASGGAHPHTLDLKINGVQPFVEAARVYALESGVTATNTLERLTAAGAARGIPALEVDAWCEAFRFIQGLRLQLNAAQRQRGEALHNHLDPATLNDLERRILREALRQARSLQSRLTRDFAVGSASFGA
jgi:CBS domain-containing protein